MTFETANIRYWDDAHARSTKLNIWAYTAPGAPFTGCTFGTSDGIQGWKTTEITPVINTWGVTARADGAQDADNFRNQNLCFSNNLVDYTPSPGTDRRFGYDKSTKKFETPKMVFYHAMSKITIHIKKGTGYTSTDPFAFATGTNVKLTNYNIKGKLCQDVFA